MRRSEEIFIYMVACSAIALSFALIPMILLAFKHKEVERSRYLQLVFMIQLADFFSCLGAVIGPQREGSFGCGYQYIMTNYFPLASCFSSLLTMTELYYIVVNAVTLSDSVYKAIRLAIIIIPAVLTLLPLSTEKIGAFDATADDDTSGGYGWCFLLPTDGDPLWIHTFWMFFCFYSWIWICVLTMTVMCMLMYFRIKTIRSKIHRNHARLSLYKLLFYPVTISLGWIAAAFVDASLSVSPNTKVKGSTYLTFFCYCFPSVVCAVNSIVFIYTNKLLLYKWILELSCYMGLTTFRNWEDNDSDFKFDHTALPRIDHENDGLTQMSPITGDDGHTDKSKGTWKYAGKGENASEAKNPICQ